MVFQHLEWPQQDIHQHSHNNNHKRTDSKPVLVPGWWYAICYQLYDGVCIEVWSRRVSLHVLPSIDLAPLRNCTTGWEPPVSSAPGSH